MLGKILHAGLVVTDMEISLPFYRNVLGLSVTAEMIMEGKETDKLFARKNARAKVVYLNGGEDKICPPVELIQFLDISSAPYTGDLFARGIAELCFEVKNIEAEYERLKNLGVEFLSEPQEFDFAKQGMGKSKAVYFKDPDGIILELIETIS